MTWSRGEPLELIHPQIRLSCSEGPHGPAVWRDGLTRLGGDPAGGLAWLETSWRELDLPRDQRWVGYLGYDLGRAFENLASPPPDGPQVSLYAFGMEPRPELIAYDDFGQDPVVVTSRRRLTSRAGYLRSVERALAYIRAGDVFQVNLAQTFAADFDGDVREVWRRLRQNAPGAYDAFLYFGDVVLVSNSPELFFRVDLLPDGRRRIVNRPIKGTRPRLPGMDVELLRSEKDQAELTMIVDLQRNDLGRICEVGSVRVTEPRAIEAHPTVYHGVATIEGILRPDVGFVDILRAVFPCGSVTGCPKIRAMQIIDELEPVRRGPYCGAIGWVAADGSMEFNVAIRTMTFANGMVYIPVGGGIVADSVPQAEYDETIVKAKAMLDALGLSANDLRD